MVLSQRARLLVVLAAPVVAFGGTELGLRVCGFSYPPRELPLRIWNANQDEELLTEQSLHQVDAASLWSPRPGGRVLEDHDEIINAGGYRGPLLGPEPPEGTIRVAILGESGVFGLGVPHEQTLAARLPQVLAERGQPAEVVNAAVIGYTLRQGLARYRALVRPLKPHVVVAGFGATNEHVPSKDLDDEAKLAHLHGQAEGLGALALAMRRELRIAHLLSWLTVPEDLGETVQEQAERTFRKERAENHATRAEYGRLDWDGTRRVDPDSYERALLELALEVEADGARLILVCMPRMPEFEASRPVLHVYNRLHRDVAREHGLRHLDMRSVFAAEVAAGADPASWFVEGHRLHPGPLGHRRIAEELAPLVRAAAR